MVLLERFTKGCGNLVLILGFLCLLLNASLWAAQTKPIVFVQKVQAKEIADQLTYPARLVPKINATVLAETEGIVETIGSPLGHAVKRGQPLLSLRNTDPVYEYAPQVVTAPVSGVVSTVEVTVGSRVSKGQKLATITNPKKIRVLVEIAATDLGLIHKGLKGTLKITGEREPIAVKIVGISPFVDPATGTASAELSITKKSKLPLFPGRLGKVSFRVGAHQGIEIPDSALLYRGDKTFVRTVKEGIAHLIPVRIGPTRRGSVEILEGLSNGATVVSRTSKYIKNGEAVEVKEKGMEE